MLDSLVPLLPKKVNNYCEPFVGGGALLFHLQPKKAIVNDNNLELISLYEVIRDNIEELLLELQNFKNDSETFYSIRDWDRQKEFYLQLSKIQRAARILYLNKTCYNGLYRVNNAGEFNAPFGFYKKPNIVNSPTLRAVNAYFNEANISFACGDYALALKTVTKNSFVYLDPPYDPISDTSNFTGYTKGGFGRAEQIRLREICDELDQRGINFMLSNSSTDFIREQYSRYNIQVIQAKRAINSIASKRGEVDEVVIRNYE